jgi:predicted ester cyclase
MTTDFMMADGDKVAARWTIVATNTGDLPIAKATGKKVTFSGINIYRFDHGKVVELWNHRDDLSMMMQLGLVPKPPAPAK